MSPVPPTIPHDPGLRRAAAVAAALEIAARHDLGPVEPRVLHDLFSVVVHLTPTPVVLRLPTVAAIDDTDPEPQAALERTELAVCSWLVERGVPTIPPSPLLPVEPQVCGPFAATAWEYVEHLPADTADAADGAGAPLDAVARLHAELAAHPGDVPFLSFWSAGQVHDNVAALASRPDLLPADDHARARRELGALDAVLGSRAAFTARFPRAALQVVHGDAPTHNLAHTSRGVVITDFEHTCLGPVEWDLALAGEEAQAAYSALARERGRPGLDPEVMAAMEAARLLQIVTLLALAPRSPGLAEGLAGVVDLWRARPEWTG